MQDQAATREILGYSFRFITAINPDRDREGNIIECHPQARYQNRRNLPLHTYGAGPFCHFQIPNHLRSAGVYALFVDGVISYVGECEDLSKRFNPGYGNISPRNCFTGGQPTNCKVNTFVLQSAKKSQRIELWFLQTPERKIVEKRLIRQLRPPWNSQLTG